MTAPVIAILDNDASFPSAMHDLLSAAGYRTLRCRPNDVLDAHALAKRIQPALVILDLWWRRGGDGWEFLKHLWADPITTQIGVVLTCGQAVAPSLQADLLRAMRCQVIRTPLDHREVLCAIAAVLGPSFVGRVPDRHVAAVSVVVPVAAARATESAQRHPVAARAARQGSRCQATKREGTDCVETNICPKCKGVLVERLRGTVMIDQCGKCGGILLDHGELEEIITMEARCHDRDDGLFSDSALHPVSPKGKGIRGRYPDASGHHLPVDERSADPPIQTAPIFPDTAASRRGPLPANENRSHLRQVRPDGMLAWYAEPEAMA
jgi:Zn-finger nucleic acid-binding protein/CheY-like chemotaxis protein